METPRLLHQQLLIDQRVEHLFRQPHSRNHVRRERAAVHLLVVLLGVVEGAFVFAERDRLAVHARGVGDRTLLLLALAWAAETHVDVNESDDEGSYDGEERPLELLKVVAHQFEHGKSLLMSDWDATAATKGPTAPADRV